jgi:hypothetical protein
MIRKQRTIILALVLFGACAFHTAKAQKVGTSSLQFLKVMPTARATAIGEAYVAVGSGIDGIFWNPAMLTGMKSHEATSTYTQWFFDTKQYALAYGLPLGAWGQVGIQFQVTDIGSISETSVDNLGYTDYQSSSNAGSFHDGFTGRNFTPRSWVLGLSFAKQMTDHFSMGLTAKYISESLWDGSTIAAPDIYGSLQTFNTSVKMVLFDFGMLYNTGYRTLRIGTSVQNFGAQVRFAQEAYPAPMVFRLGVAVDVMGKNALLSESSNNCVTLATDIIQPNDYDQQLHFGAEYMFADLFALRVGYKWNYDADGLTFGGGAKFDLDMIGISVDYSYGSMSEFLTNVHRISLGVKFK